MGLLIYLFLYSTHPVKTWLAKSPNFQKALKNSDLEKIQS